ncbi:putative MYST-like histone acetyltransferase 1 [Prosopis cineraria]|uniref:putative MYST-like histone acetyltransferase 1 n=1 Tax=Prosopis cineraria TaxID=364024 RepID=UPI00240FD914|nr:putative MYST-like histone acetyltransferase 1 [Prosopis cineraria]XP_054794494.1 putative MYST-like histone acetyltransferase 1 [Prosopis cineraria]XP_054794495.1 putative MYST-like histone acetyltransferase 1 [Prosopis cineraria]XP_054794496.1 putative MYST-like histone acetyltransferase 1 [Prosopis cineraria]
MGSLETPTRVENGSAPLTGTGKISSGDGEPVETASEKPLESDTPKKGRASLPPLDVGTRVMCRKRDGKLQPVKVIERRKMSKVRPIDYDCYVHYTEFNRRLDEWVKVEQLDLDLVEAVDEKLKVTSLEMTRQQKRRIDETHRGGP